MSISKKTVDLRTLESKSLHMRQSCALSETLELLDALDPEWRNQTEEQKKRRSWSEYLSARGGCREQDLETELHMGRGNRHA